MSKTPASVLAAAIFAVTFTASALAETPNDNGKAAATRMANAVQQDASSSQDEARRSRSCKASYRVQLGHPGKNGRLTRKQNERCGLVR
jgi:hypothetical protein